MRCSCSGLGGLGAVENVDPMWEAALGGDVEALLVLADVYQADGAKLDWGMKRYADNPTNKTRDDLLGDILIHTMGAQAAVKRVDTAVVRQANLVAGYGREHGYRGPKPKGSVSKRIPGVNYPEPPGRQIVGRLLMSTMLAWRERIENLKGIYAVYVSEDLVMPAPDSIIIDHHILVAAGVGVRNEFGEIRVSEGWPLGYPQPVGYGEARFQYKLPVINRDYDSITSIIALMRKGQTVDRSEYVRTEIYDPLHGDWNYINIGGTIPISGNSQNRPTAFGFWRYERRSAEG